MTAVVRSSPDRRTRGAAAVLLVVAGVGGGLAMLVVSVAVAITIGPADIGVGDAWSVVASRLGWGDDGADCDP